jgi:hypothetical protein
MTGAEIRCLTVADRAAWEAVTAEALPAQSWGHAAGLAAGGWDPELAVVTAGRGAEAGRLILPFHRRKSGRAVDVATLPGLSGALLQGAPLAPLRAWADFAAAQGWVAGYMQLAPVAEGLPREGLLSEGLGRIAEHNALFVFDLASWDIDDSIGANMRRSIRLGGRLGARLVTDPARIGPVFAALYARTLARGTTPAAFGGAVLAGWFAQAGTLAFAAEVGGEIVAAQLGRASGGWADLHLAGATDAGRPCQAWLIARAIEACRSMGLRQANIGGYGVAGDGLHRMKARLGAREVPLRSLRQVYDPARFAALCAAAGADPEDAYFPPWRRPRG